MRDFMRAKIAFCLMVSPFEKVTKMKAEITFFSLVLLFLNVLFLSFACILRF